MLVYQGGILVESDFIKPQAVYKKLNPASAMEQTIYLYGISGSGKTEVIKHYLNRKRYLYLTCQNGVLQKKNGASISTITSDIVVIDDLQFLKEQEERSQVISLINQKDLWVILLSRSPLPGWLNSIYLEQGIFVVSESELSWQIHDIISYFSNKGLTLTVDQAQEIHNSTEGHALGIRLLCQLTLEKGSYSSEILTLGQKTFFDYIEKQFLPQWNDDFIDFLMRISFVEKFTIQLAEMITGRNDVYYQLAEAFELGNFLTKTSEGNYQLRKILRMVLQYRAKRLYGREWCHEIYYNTGLYYEIQNDITTALSFYEKSNNRNRIRELLVRNGRRHPGSGHYYELRKYYFALTEEEVLNNPVLITGICMLYSLLLQPDQSEYWYDKLLAFEKDSSLSGSSKEIESLLAYLDISFPQRGVKSLISIFQSLPGTLLNRGVMLPEISITSNQPSIMNGAKDLCEWSKRDKEIAVSLGEVVPLALGNTCKGLGNIAVAESQYEKVAISMKFFPC